MKSHPTLLLIDNTFANDEIYGIRCEPNGLMWFATEGGVSRYDGEEISTLTAKDGLGSNFVQAIHRDLSGKLWFGTNSAGVSVWDGTAWASLDTRDGLADNNVFAVWTDRDGSLWFGTYGGPTRYRRSEASPLVYINSVSTDRVYKDLSEIPPVTVGTRVTIETSLVEGFKAGGVDYITKPFEKEELLTRVENHLKISHLTQELLQKNEELRQEIDRRGQEEKARKRAEDALQKADDHLELISQQEASRWGIDAFVGKSSTIKGILDEVHQLQSARRTSVLIVGESGTGKELIARAIHFGGEKAGGPFIPVNCSAIPRDLAESLLLGHVRGAFTGADRSRKGYFELADGGTLFLDEIGDMPPELQPKLLRVLEDGCFITLGGAEETHVDARIIAATNQDLLKKSSRGAFREDLFFRLAHITVTVPPLRERKEDIPLLAKHFLRIFSEEMRIPQPVLSPEALKMLKGYRFPGNVRELKSIIEYALLKSGGGLIIMPEHLHFLDANAFPATYTNPPVAPQEDQPSLDLHQLEQLVIDRARKTAGGQDEEKILAHVREHGSINNAECRELLSVNKRRAAYLLQKLCRYGLLVCKGEFAGRAIPSLTYKRAMNTVRTCYERMYI